MKRFSVLVLAALVVLAQARATAQTPQPYVLNVVLSLTGLAAFIGGDEATAFRAFEATVNRSGGLRGTPIHFQIYDDQTQPAVAVQLLGQILPQHPAVVFGSSLVAQTLAMVPLVAKDGPVLYADTPNFVPDKGGYVYSSGANTALITLASINYYSARKLTKFAMLVTNDASGQNNIAGLENALKLPEAPKGLSIVDIERFSPGDLSVSAQVAKIKASGAQVIFALANGTAFGVSLHGLADAGMLDVPIYTSAANFSPAFLNGLKAVLPDELDAGGPSFFNRERPASDPLKAPIDRFYAALAEQGVHQPTAGHSFAWDPALIVFTALQKTGPNPTPAQLRAAIDSLKRFPGASGLYDFSTGDRHGLGVDSQLVFKNDKNDPGRVIVVSRPGGAPL